MFLCFDLPNLSSTLNLTIIELDDGKIYRKALYLMVKTMVSCRFSLKPTQWNYCLPGLLPSDFSAFLGVSKKFKGRRPMSSFWVSTQEVGPVPWANWVFFGRPCLVFWAFRCISYVISIGCIHGIYIYGIYSICIYDHTWQRKMRSESDTLSHHYLDGKMGWFGQSVPQNGMV